MFFYLYSVPQKVYLCILYKYPVYKWEFEYERFINRVRRV